MLLIFTPFRMVTLVVIYEAANGGLQRERRHWKACESRFEESNILNGTSVLWKKCRLRKRKSQLLY